MNNSKKVFSGLNKHKLWLIIGISIVVILILSLVFPAVKETLFGESAREAARVGKAAATCQFDSDCSGRDEICLNGFCSSPCIPDCIGKECGDDGCGGSCGTCLADKVCSPDGICFSSAPERDCADGLDNDADGYIDCADPDCSGFIGISANNQNVICDFGSSETCSTFGDVRYVENPTGGGLFDALCFDNSGYSTWRECDVDNHPEKKGVNGVTDVSGTILSAGGCNYLCHEFGGSFESWIGCNCKISNNGGVFAQLGDSYGNYLCDNDIWAVDTDGDGVPDADDNCPTIPNPNQEDADQNGVGDACEAQLPGDVNGDGCVNIADIIIIGDYVDLFCGP